MIEFLNDIPDWISVIVALSGLFFGLVTIYFKLTERHIFLRLNPFVALPIKDGSLNVHKFSPDNLQFYLLQGRKPAIAIQVVNLSKFPVVIEEVGFCYNSPKKGLRAAFTTPFIISSLSSTSLPSKLEPRASVTVYVDGDYIARISEGMKKAYAITSCDKTKTKYSKPFLRNVSFIKKYVEKI